MILSLLSKVNRKLNPGAQMDEKVLIVAPETDLLLVRDEVAVVVNLLGAHVLQGTVTIHDVVDKLAEEWDILWFATHGDERGILLSDGILSASELTTFVRTAGAYLTVLNTCASLNAAMAIHNELLTDFVCTIRDVPDREAFLTGKQLAIQLSRGLNSYDAYLAAKPGQNRNYLYLVGSEGSMPAREERTGEDAEELRRLAALIDGSPRWNTPGILNTVRDMKERVDKIESNLQVIKISAIAFGLINFLMLVTLLVLSFSG